MAISTADSLNTNEDGAIYKDWRLDLRIALVYPNTYHVGMSNLGFQTVYQLFNALENVVCERVFMPDKPNQNRWPIKSIESGRLLTDFDIVAFSIAFENDFQNIPAILEFAGIPPITEDRDGGFPLIMAGGVACMINPEPIADFVDCCFIGEAEDIIAPFVFCYDAAQSKKENLLRLAGEIPGIYVPSFYRVDYEKDGRIKSFEPMVDVPAVIKRVYSAKIDQYSTCSTIITENTTFTNTYLIEVSRGCPHGCRFCSAGYIYRPPRFRRYEQLAQDLKTGIMRARHIGLVGAAVTDLPDIKKICTHAIANNIRLSFSSFRADAISPELIDVLKFGRVKSATLAPDAGSERMRRIIKKGISETDLLSAVEQLVTADIPNIKLYFMVGLPFEESDDIDEIVMLCKKIKQQFLSSSRIKGKIGDITVAVNSFVPKPFTPFQWTGMSPLNDLKVKLKQIKSQLAKVANVRVHMDIPRWAYIQAIFARGDRRTGKLLTAAFKNRWNWPQTLKDPVIDPDFFVLRRRDFDEHLPWDFIDHGFSKSSLAKEYERAESAANMDV